VKLQGSKTEINVLKTFAGESRASVAYMLFAEKARKEGYEYIASIFESTGRNELAHARETFEALKLIRTTSENLKYAIEGEKEESESIYVKYAKEAKEEGFEELENLFSELAETEEHHEKRFKAIKELLDSGRLFKNQTSIKWQCMNCGYIHVGKEAPRRCPLCGLPQGYFKRYSEDFK